jgi:tetratricopeptide (TPR) repeat protein
VLLDRRKVKFWQRIVFGGMAFLMAAFLVVGYSGVLNGCTWFDSSAETAVEDLNQQIAKYQAAVKADPQDATAWDNLGQQLEYRANQEQPDSAAQQAWWNQAADAYAKADEILAGQKGKAAKEQRLAVLGRIVDIRLFLQDYEGATSLYGEITELTPKDPQAFFDMATIAISAGDTNTALLAFNKFLELDPKSPDAPQVKAWIEENSQNSTPKPSPSPTT